MNVTSSWQTWAVLSAIFAALTAIFAKIGVENVNSDLATFIRTIVVIVTLGFLLAVTGQFQAPGRFPGAHICSCCCRGWAPARLALLFSRAQDRRGRQGRADRQIVGWLAIFGVIFLGERLSTPNWLGIALIAVGAVLVAYR